MKKLLPILSIVLVFATACSDNLSLPPANEDLSTPEKVEKDLREIAGRGWKELADTLAFFESEFLSKGATSGIGSDGVYYCLYTSDNVTKFLVEDSVFVQIETSTDGIYARACNTDIVATAKEESLSVLIDNIKLNTESATKRRIDVEYYGTPCGYIVWEHFENTDYTDGYYPVMYYLNDTRTFAFYEDIYLFELWNLIGNLRS